MNELNLDTKLIELDGSTNSGTLAKILAKILAYSSEGLNPLKAYDWSKSLHDTGSFQIDDTDLTLLKGFIESAKTLPNISRAQILLALEKKDAKDAKDDKAS